ncbi:hypothetical protein Sta7437_4037 [Stanieria cyanosphaera PCC 7437]|uniref:Uncharacterized protein n=1 Tax=Stanieria cyanosphaera (strain ATCC 29371 / PCC 7437) TaxID=111780 RepID=K9XZP0_STAC7|nr:hypothetical protein [Stanieria cyanosphaera]AFZ37514.1 hypothetical protein Sta7437_4037 [Stanieria cyanosphaera PCC 7437]
MNLISATLIGIVTIINLINLPVVLNRELIVKPTNSLVNLAQIDPMRRFDQFWRNQTVNTSVQQNSTTITLDSRNLSSSHYLKIITNSTKITGTITVNDRKLISLNSSETSLDLAPRLVKGMNTIEIVGNYSPSNANVTIQFSGVGNSITQQSSGSGILQHKLIINVR